MIATTDSNRHSTGDIHSVSGIMSACTARDYKQPKQVCIKIIGEVNSSQDGQVHDISGAAKCHSAGHNNSPKVAIPVLTPDRTEKRQNGRRFKENGEPMFSLTAQDRHGVALEIKGIYDFYNKKMLNNEYVGTLTSNTGLSTTHCGTFGAVLKIKEATKQGYALAEPGDSINLSVPESKTRRGRVGKGIAQTLDTSCNQGTPIVIHVDKLEPLGVLRNVRTDYGKEIRKAYEAGDIVISRHKFLAQQVKEDGCSNTISTVQKDNLLAVSIGETQEQNNGIYVEMPEGFMIYAIWYEKEQCYIAIRRLTPKECFRLQGWTDDYFEKAAFVNSDSQLYKQAGNGVTVDVVYEIGRRIAETETRRGDTD